MKLSIVFLLAAQALSQELTSTLHSTLYGIRLAFVDEMVTFTCVVRGSSMAWTSDEYIGADQQLIILSGDPLGVPNSAVGKPQTVAELVNATTSEIVSQLRIRVESNFPVASVQCQDSTANTVTSTTFRFAGVALVKCDRLTVCSGGTVTCACTTGNSNSLTWITDGSRLQFSSSDAPPTRRNGSGTFAVLTENSNRNGVRVIMSNITIIVSTSSNDREVTLICENSGSMAQPVILPILENCPMIQPTDQITTTTPAGSEAQRDSCSGPIAAAVVPVIVIFLLLMAGISIAEVVLLYIAKYKPLQGQYNEKVTELSTSEEQKNQAIKAKGEAINAKEAALTALETEKGEKERAQDAVQELQKKLNEETEAKVAALKDLQLGEANKKAKVQELQKKLKEKEQIVLQLKQQMTEIERKMGALQQEAESQKDMREATQKINVSLMAEKTQIEAELKALKEAESETQERKSHRKGMLEKSGTWSEGLHGRDPPKPKESVKYPNNWRP